MISSKLVKFGDREIAAVRHAAQSGDFGGNSESVHRYEAALEEYFGTEHALACASGTAALLLALKAVGVGTGDEVAVSPAGAVMSALPVLALGAIPVFVDLARGDGFVIDAGEVKDVASGRTKAVITVSMWGYPSVDGRLKQTCEDLGLTLVEDSAQAAGSVDRNRYLGTDADIGCFSTHARKLINTGEGGFLLTDRDHLAEAAHIARTLGQLPGENEFGFRFGMNLKLSGLLAAVGRVQLEGLAQRVERRNAVGDQWLELLQTVTDLRCLERPDVHNGYGFAIKISGSAARQQRMFRDQVAATDTHLYSYRPLYDYPIFAPYARSCPRAESFCRDLIVLPCHEEITRVDAERVRDTLQQTDL